MKISRCLSFLALIFTVYPLLGQNYSAFGIKPELTKNATAVFRLYETNYVVKDTGKAVMNCHFIITVLNNNGDDFGEFEEYYDQFSEMTALSGKIYNNAGVLVKKLKSSDFSDLSAVSNASIFDDNRVKYYKPFSSSYPYTVEYEFTMEYNGFINIPSWHPQTYYDLSVEKAVYNLTAPKNYNIRYKPVNNASNPVLSETGSTKLYHLEVENLPVLEYEILSSGLSDIAQLGYFIPEYFKYGGISGRNNDWKSLGLYFTKLNNLPNTLSPKTISDLSELKKKSTSQKDLVKLVYEYMQSKTRYVSIQLGLGGFQPFDASIVDKYGYGDCKALSNYTKVLLKEVGIPSIYTLVRAKKNTPNIITDESFNQFNHAMLCVPIEKDTIWLECTSQVTPFAFIGTFTDNRNVLLITDDGGILAKTKTYTQENNLQTRSGIIQISADGKADAKINTHYTGLQYDDNEGILYSKPEDQKEGLYEQINLPTFVINDYKLSENRSEIPSLDININLTATKYATKMGNRLLLPLNFLSRRKPLPDINKERKTRMWLRYAYIDSDTITYQLPEGYALEALPKNIDLESEFGTYSYKVINNAEQNTLKYIRVIKVKDGIYPAEKYKDYVSFIKSVSTYDNLKVSLLQKS